MALVALAGCSGLISSGSIAHAGRAARGRVARTINGNDQIHTHLVRANGSTLYETGRATGALSGRVRIRGHLGATLTATMVLYTRHGQIKARGTARLRGGHYPWERFAGSATVTGGTHRYRHARGTVALAGEFNRKTYALVVHSHGRLHY